MNDTLSLPSPPAFSPTSPDPSPMPVSPAYSLTSPVYTPISSPRPESPLTTGCQSIRFDLIARLPLELHRDSRMALSFYGDLRLEAINFRVIPIPDVVPDVDDHRERYRQARRRTVSIDSDDVIVIE